MSRITQIIETLEAEKAELRTRLEWVDEQLETFREHAATADVAQTEVPKRSTRRRTARRASTRRHTARSVRRDLGEEIAAFVAEHPNSTAGDVAKGVNANRNTVATRMSQLVKTGVLEKAERGYAVPRAS